MSSARSRGNALLSVLPEAEWARLEPALEPMDMALGDVLYESGEPLDSAYFPTTSIVSLLYVMKEGSTAELAVVGFEGMVGVALILGGQTMPNRAVVQSAGRALRLRKKTLIEEFQRGGVFSRLMLRYTQALMTQMIQTAACNRHHTIDQQLCRWLLLSLDRLSTADLRMTQELMAGMLGVRREGVTEAAGKLQAAGLIRYTRGRIRVLDRQGVEKRVCECYEVVRKEFDRLLPDVMAT